LKLAARLLYLNKEILLWLTPPLLGLVMCVSVTGAKLTNFLSTIAPLF
jgi:membrane glycosyltransferase